MFTLLVLSTPMLLQQPGGGQYISTWQHELSSNGDNLLAIADLDSDGVDDWLHVDRIRQGTVTAISGKLGGEIWSYEGPGSSANMGLEASGIVDLEGDGRKELIFSLPLYKSYDWDGSGLFLVVDSLTGQLLWERGGDANQEKLSKNLLLADFDGDGVQEIVLSSRGKFVSDKISCFTAAGTLLWQIELDFDGRTMQAVDLNGDGTPEILLADHERRSGIVYGLGKLTALNSNTGQVIWERWGLNPSEQLGGQMLIQDLDRDGILDILAFGPRATINGVSEVGTVARLSALDGTDIWRLQGSAADDQFGGIVQVADIDGNGIDDLVAGIPTYAQDDGMVLAVECANGTPLWQSAGTQGAQAGHGQNLWLQDFQNTGQLQVLVEQRQGQGAGNQHSYAGWKLLNAANGQIIWGSPYAYTAWQDSVYHFQDLNGDGRTEAVVQNPEVEGVAGVGGKTAGLVLVMDSDGQVLWSERGTRSDQYYGSEVELSDLNMDGVSDLLIQAPQAHLPNSSSRGLIEARDGISGDLLWQLEGLSDYQKLADSFELFDLNHDGISEVISSSPEALGWRGSFQGEMRVIDGATGDLLWRLDGNSAYAYLSKDLGVSPDRTGDGWDEVVLLGDSKITDITGSGNFQGFMMASDDFISASVGGTIDLPMDFPVDAGWWQYRVAFSAHGTGLNYEFGLPIPLTLDHWLYRSMAGGLPITHLRNGEGVLDSDGRATAQIRFGPGEIPSQMIGLSLTFATVARLPWQDWQYCSVPVSILIQP
jgi:outer membrane protein assembly factor BamB